MGQMLRTLALFVAAFSCAHATLILQIPTADGMLVASDTRSVGEGQCDERQKLMPLDTQPPAIASATGWTITIDQKSLAAGGSFCDALETGDRDYDLQAVVEKYFEEKLVDREAWTALPGKLIDSLFLFKMKYDRAAAELFRPASDLYTVILAFWGPSGLISANTTIGVARTRTPYLKHAEWREYTQSEPFQVEAYGDVSAYQQAIASGPLAEELKILHTKTINLVRTGDAWGFARRAIGAAAGDSRHQVIGSQAEGYMVGPRSLRRLVVKAP
jgi:hypothetical protein